MIRSCFVAALSGKEGAKGASIICRYTPEDSANHDPLPSASNLASFCFPTGPENIKAREYMAPVVGPSPERHPGSIQLLGLHNSRLYRLMIGSVSVQEYSFTLTGGDGSRLHGFCRCSGLPTSLCFLSDLSKRFEDHFTPLLDPLLLGASYASQHPLPKLLSFLLKISSHTCWTLYCR